MTEQDLSFVVGNVMLFDHLADDLRFYSAEVIRSAVINFAKLIKQEPYGYPGEALTRESRSREIDLENVSHVIKRVTLTEIGFDVEIRLIGTPRGCVVQHWMDDNGWKLHVRRGIICNPVELQSFDIITIDILRLHT